MSGLTAVVIGAGGGIGHALVEEMAASGCVHGSMLSRGARDLMTAAGEPTARFGKLRRAVLNRWD